jgi:hypothetical protein
MINLIVEGYIGKTIRTNDVGDNTVVNFSVAHNQSLSKTKADGSDRRCPKGWVESENKKYWTVVTWLNVAAWNQAWLQEALAKAKLVRVFCDLAGEVADGKMNPRIWADKEGYANTNFEVTAYKVDIVVYKDGNNGGSAKIKMAPETTGVVLPSTMSPDEYNLLEDF